MWLRARLKTAIFTEHVVSSPGFLLINRHVILDKHVACLCVHMQPHWRETGRQRDRRRERRHTSCHLRALLWGNTSCFDMSHNLWESVLGLAPRKQSEQSGNRMWEKEKPQKVQRLIRCNEEPNPATMVKPFIVLLLRHDEAPPTILSFCPVLSTGAYLF